VPARARISPDPLVEAGQVVAERSEQLGQDVPDPVLSWAIDSSALRAVPRPCCGLFGQLLIGSRGVASGHRR